MTLRTIYHVVDFCWRNQGFFTSMENLVLLPSDDDDSKIWYTIYQYMNSYIHIIYLHILYIYISVHYIQLMWRLNPLDIHKFVPEIVSTPFRWPALKTVHYPPVVKAAWKMPVDDFWFLIFTQSQVNDDHCLGIWNFIHLSINILTHIYIYLEQWQSKPCIPGISHCHVWLQRVSQCGKCWPRLGISKVFSCRRIDHPDGAGSLWTLLLWIPWWVAKKNRMNQTPVYELAVVVLVYISPFCVDRSNGRWFAGNQ